MRLRVEIKRKADGAVATYVWENWMYNTFWWAEGNASCDCNREAFFAEARGEDVPDDTECGRGRFVVRLTDFDTNEVLYDEMEQQSNHLRGRDAHRP